MKVMVVLLSLMTALVFGGVVQAQEQVWIQIEDQPTLREAEDRARAYAGVFPDVAGFQLAAGRYAVVLGPYAPDAAQARLAALTAERLVPAGSIIAASGSFARQFWPAALAGVTLAPVEQSPLADPAAVASLPEPVAPTATGMLDSETPAQARRAEAALSREERQALQSALQWFGFYTAAIDGAFGPGTRKSMAAWQEANGLAPTGILTTLQRQVLLVAQAQAQAELGLQTVTEPESGIEITLPLALVQFDRFDPPFVHYRAKDGSGVSVLLISQPGDQATLYGLYDLLQTLEVVPLEGERSRDDHSFSLIGRSATVESHSYGELSQGLVKGYMLVWGPDQDAERMARVLAAMQASFKPVGEHALDPGLVVIPDAAREGLLAGLEVRRPARSRSGFFVDAEGMVLTTVEATQGCARITLDHDTEAEVALSDASLGIALLKPRQALAPAAVAQWQTGAARPGSEVAVAGYSYEDTLPAPSLTFGTYEDGKGLNGEPGLARLALEALPGDAGGPVFDSAGNVLAMLLPAASGGARQLPAGVSFAASAPVLAGRLTEAGIAPADPAVAPRAGAMAPEDLTALAARMTVLVSCWN